jgi:hypothetical protein
MNNKGPFSYENWKAALNGLPVQTTYEVPLFTDVRIIGTKEECGPYQFINTEHRGVAGTLRQAIILRVEYRLVDDLAHEFPEHTENDRYHGGDLNDEVAALASLILGSRMKAGELTRRYDSKDPKGWPLAVYENDTPYLSPIAYGSKGAILPRAINDAYLDQLRDLCSLIMLAPDDASVLVRVARLYQDALWVAESEPQLTWLFLVSAIETAADHWSQSEDSSLERLRFAHPKLVKELIKVGGEEHALNVAEMLSGSLGATQKFVNFILNFLTTPPRKRPPERAQVSWVRDDLKKILKKVYEHRSRALHGGKPFPPPMCNIPGWVSGASEFCERSPALAVKSRGGTWIEKDYPINLHMFEYIARGALCLWWKSMVPDPQ